MSNLDTRIAEAEAAQAAIAEQEALRATAQGLDDLLEEQRLEEELKAAEQRLGASRLRAKQQLAAAAEVATSWRERFSAVCKEFEALARELPEIQQSIFSAGRELYQSVQRVNQVGFVAPDPTRGDFSQGTSYALRQGRAVSFHALLSECGGTNLALNVWPKPGADPRSEAASLRYALREFLRKRTGLVCYDPQAGVRNF